MDDKFVTEAEAALRGKNGIAPHQDKGTKSQASGTSVSGGAGWTSSDLLC
jgi:hypothetical protein